MYIIITRDMSIYSGEGNENGPYLVVVSVIVVLVLVVTEMLCMTTSVSVLLYIFNNFC